MKTILFTAYDEKYKPLADLTVPLMGAYAKRHGMDFMFNPGPLLQTQDGIYWTKFVAALDYLQEDSGYLKVYDRFIWLDSDIMITNPDWRIPDDWKSGLHIGKDWGNDVKNDWDVSACGFVAHKDCIPFLEELMSMEPESRGNPFPEQTPLRELIKACLVCNKAKIFEHPAAEIHIHPRNVFNCVPEAVAPGEVPEPWKPGDWCCHLTMFRLSRRIELFHEIKKQI